MLLELLRPLSFFASMLSLYPVLLGAFFVPGAGWQERLAAALLRLAMSAAVCLASGLLYARWSSPGQKPTALPLTLPMRMFFCGLAGMAVLFVVSWYLDAYFMPLASRSCCRL